MVSATFSLFSLLLLLLLESGQGNAATPRERAEALLAQMTLNEKLSMVRGYSGHPYVGFVEAVPRLNIPALTLEDGPQGVADGVHNVTCWPSALTIVASWSSSPLPLLPSVSPGLAPGTSTACTSSRLPWPLRSAGRAPTFGSAPWSTSPACPGAAGHPPKPSCLWGDVMMWPTAGADCSALPLSLLALPPLYLCLCSCYSRNFESFGEDPYLAAEMARFNVRGAQSQGVMATVKHWANNNQEYNRSTTSANLPDDRTQVGPLWLSCWAILSLIHHPLQLLLLLTITIQ